jgi:hypothetical protein
MRDAGRASRKSASKLQIVSALLGKAAFVRARRAVGARGIIGSFKLKPRARVRAGVSNHGTASARARCVGAGTSQACAASIAVVWCNSGLGSLAGIATQALTTILRDGHRCSCRRRVSHFPCLARTRANDGSVATPNGRPAPTRAVVMNVSYETPSLHEKSIMSLCCCMFAQGVGANRLEGETP